MKARLTLSPSWKFLQPQALALQAVEDGIHLTVGLCQVVLSFVEGKPQNEGTGRENESTPCVRGKATRERRVRKADQVVEGSKEEGSLAIWHIELRGLLRKQEERATEQNEVS